MVIKKKNISSHKRSARALVLLIAGVLFFSLTISTSALAGEIFQRDDGTGWEYGKDDQGRPTATIHYRKDPYEWSIHKGGKEVRTYDPKTGGPIHNQFSNDEGVLQWEEVIDPETGDTTKTDYFDLNGNPKVTTSTYNNYWVKEAAIERREGVKDEEDSLFDGFDEWSDNLDKGLQKWADQWKDFISGGSLGITKKGTQDTPAQPDQTGEPKPSDTPPTPSSTGRWDFLKEYDPRDFTPKPPSSEEANPPSGEEAKKRSGGLLAPSKSSDTAKINVPSSPDLPVILESAELIDSKGGSDVSPKPFFTNTLGSFNEPTPKEIDFNKYGNSVGFDPQRSLTFVTNSKTGEITYFYPRQDDQFKDPQGGTQVVTMLNGKVVREDTYDHLGELMAPVPSDRAPVEKRQTTPEEREKLYDQMIEQYEREERDKKYDQMIKEYEEKQELEKRYDKLIEDYERQERDKRYDKMIEEYEKKEKAKQGTKSAGISTTQETGDNTGIFTAFDALQSGGVGLLDATPTATLDAGPQSRDMETGISGGESKPEPGGSGTECDH